MRTIMAICFVSAFFLSSLVFALPPMYKGSNAAEREPAPAHAPANEPNKGPDVLSKELYPEGGVSGDYVSSTEDDDDETPVGKELEEGSDKEDDALENVK